jgi:uncharacterized protein (DUF433 family)
MNMESIVAQDRIIQDPNIKFGKPVIAGTRVTVELILRLLSIGRSIEDLLQEYPKLTREDIAAAQFFAAELVARQSSQSAAE